MAEVENSDGQIISGQTVNFTVVAGGGSVFAGAATSDANGIVRERWTLGATAGVQTVEVRAVDSNGVGVVYATFHATAIAGEPYTVSILSENNQLAHQIQSLPATVFVEDIYGNPNSGVSVTFTPDNGGVAIPPSIMTDELGLASTTWTLGQLIGTQNLSASVAGFNPVVFIADVERAPPSQATALIKKSGDMQEIAQYTLLPSPISVTVTDILGNPVPNIPITFSALGGSSDNNPLTISTDSYGDGTASWTGPYFRTAGVQEVVVSSPNLASVSFTVNVLASTHKYDGLYKLTFSDRFSYADPEFTIANGQFISDIFLYAWYGELNEVDGSFSAKFGDNNFGLLTGQMEIDSMQNVSCSGIYKEYRMGDPSGVNGTFTCIRQ